jgi:hypothetical protein
MNDQDLIDLGVNPAAFDERMLQGPNTTHNAHKKARKKKKSSSWFPFFRSSKNKNGESGEDEDEYVTPLVFAPARCSCVNDTQCVDSVFNVLLYS